MKRIIILLVLILFSVTVLAQEERCTGPKGFECVDFKQGDGKVDITLKNTLGYTLKSITLKTVGESFIQCNNPEDFKAGETKTFSCPAYCQKPGLNEITILMSPDPERGYDGGYGEVILNTPKENVIACTDTDGKDYFTKGTISGEGWEREESCKNMGRGTVYACYDGYYCRLEENVCNTCGGSRLETQVFHNCEFGCKDGACIKSIEERVTCKTFNTLKEGEVKNITFNKKKYEFNITSLAHDQVNMIINEKNVDRLIQGDAIKLEDGNMLIIQKIETSKVSLCMNGIEGETKSEGFLKKIANWFKELFR